MPDFSTFEGIRQAREALYVSGDTTFVFDRRYMLKEAEESLLAQEQLKLYSKGGG